MFSPSPPRKKERLAGRKINLQRRPSAPKEEEGGGVSSAANTFLSLSFRQILRPLSPPPLSLLLPSSSSSSLLPYPNQCGRSLLFLPPLLAVCPCVCPALPGFAVYSSIVEEGSFVVDVLIPKSSPVSPLPLFRNFAIFVTGGGTDNRRFLPHRERRMEEDLTPLPSVRGTSPYIYTASNFQQRGGRGGGEKTSSAAFCTHSHHGAAFGGCSFFSLPLRGYDATV